MAGRVLVMLAISIAATTPGAARSLPGRCQAVIGSHRIEIRSPDFVFRLDTSYGLRALSWKNRLTGRTVYLGPGPEFGINVGQPDGPFPLVTPRWRVTGVHDATESRSGRVRVELAAEKPWLAAEVTYEWTAEEPVLRKYVAITNRGAADLDRLLDVRLGLYRTSSTVTCREQGFPLYLDGEFFMALAHPAGWAMGEGGRAELRHHPGVRVKPGETVRCMEAVYGVGEEGGGRAAFLKHLRARTRRVVRGHDHPYAIFEPFGARPDGNFDETEDFVLDNIAKVAEGQRDSGCHFDLYSVDFWVDYNGDLKACDPARFPNGLTRIKEALRPLDTAPGLWIDSAGTSWSIGGNPSVQGCLNFDPKEGPGSAPMGRASFCRATEPIRSMYTEAFRYHIRENGARLLKFDNFADSCNNTSHDHLPGMYSTEAIDDAAIEFLHALDAECPDVFLMLYWGYRSPWWLLHADTLFDSGIGIEAASPSTLPAPFARDSVTQRLDQAQWHSKDVPPLGKDSLGVWLSSWGWNSCVGKERWQEGFIMDISRGSMLAQPWSDTAWLSPEERRQMADFIALLKARPDCFGNPLPIVGDPWKDEPYGYSCSNGERAFLALNNCAWHDSTLPLHLGREWGLPENRRFAIYRWYPAPARLRGPRDTFGTEASIGLRPFEVVLLEVVPADEPPTLAREFAAEQIPVAFAEPTRAVDVSVERPLPPEPAATDDSWTVLVPDSLASSEGATLTPQDDGSVLASGRNVALDTYTVTATITLSGITGFRLEALPDPSLPDSGPGRAVNGNFALVDFSVTASPAAGGAAAPVALSNPLADFSQEGHGGWPVAAAIDGNRETGWSIDPEEGVRHVAVFEVVPPIGLAGGTRLTFTLAHGVREHNLGRFRIAATTAAPLPTPPPRPRSTLMVTGEVPSCAVPSVMVVALEVRRDGEPMWLGNVGTHFAARASVGGVQSDCTPVLGMATYPAPWQAWRIPLAPSRRPRVLRLEVDAKLPPLTEFAARAYLTPAGISPRAEP